MPTPEINLLAVVIAAAANMALGMFWYSHAGFGKPWMALIGITPEKIEEAKKKGMGKTMAAAFVGSLVMAYVLAHFAFYAQATDMMGAIQLGFWTWLGFVATIGLNMVLWEGKPWKLYAINVGYYLISLPVMSLILVLWK